MDKTSWLPRLLVCHYPPRAASWGLDCDAENNTNEAVLARAFAIMEGWMGPTWTRLGAKGVCPPVEWNKP